MQEYGWLYWNDFYAMARVVGKGPASRKMRLAACACLRRVWALIEDRRLRIAVETAEDYANFQVNRQQLKAVRASLSTIIEEARVQVLYDKEAVPDWAAADPECAEWRLHLLANEMPAARQLQLIDPVLRCVNLDANGLCGLQSSVLEVVRSSR